MEAVYTCYVLDKEAGGGEDKAPEELKDFLTEAKADNNFITEWDQWYICEFKIPDSSNSTSNKF